MSQRLKHDEARRNAPRFKRTYPKYKLVVDVVEVGGGFLVHVDYSADDRHLNTRSSDMFRAKGRGNVKRIIKKAAQSMFDLRPSFNGQPS